MFVDELIYTINCYISGGASIALTMLLILAIIFKTPKEMKSYRVFLLNISFTDLLLSLGMILLQPVPASSVKEVSNWNYW